MWLAVGGVRRRVYEILTIPRPGDRVGRAISIALLALIAANVVASILETDAMIRREAATFFDTFEVVSIAVFGIEYALRLWSCVEDPRFRDSPWGRVRHASRPMAVVDLVAILPSFIQLAAPGAFDLRFVRALRLMRVFRLLRVGPLAGALGTLSRVVRSRLAALAVSLSIVFLTVLLAAGAIYLVEQSTPSSPFTSIPRALWWSIVTITTIGYGDMIPVTPVGQVIAGILAFVGICAIALPVGIVSSGYIEELGRARREASQQGSCPYCGRENEGDATGAAPGR